MAAAFATHAGLAATSAGFTGDGVAAPALAVKVMAERGIDLSGHRSRQVTEQMIRESDLVITMTRRHLIDVVMLSPRKWSHCFTFTDVLRRGEQIGAVSREQDLAAWIGSVSGARSRTSLLSLASADDIGDPMGRRRHAFAETAAQLESMVLRLAGLIGPV